MGKPEEAKRVVISPPNTAVVAFRLRGTTPYVQNAFSAKARAAMRAKHEAGSVTKKGSKREPKNFQEVWEGALHKSREGWYGMPASGFRAAMISACRLAGFKMTLAKLSVFVEADGFDAVDDTPLVRITKGEPQYAEHYVRNETGVVDLRPRPMWKEGWETVVRVRYDADQFTLTDVANLLMRVGMQVGIGEGRPDSKNSAGMGWGLFELAAEEQQAAA